MIYKSFSDLSKAIFNKITILQQMNIGLVVGIPRSGMLPANLIALYLNVPYTDIDSFIENRIYGAGDRQKYIKAKSNNVLVIDDSISAGIALKKAKDKLKNVKNYNLIYGAVYARSNSKHLVNFYCEVVDGDRIWEWNLFHNQLILGRSCLDIDGVLCRDPRPEENDDGEKYHKFLISAEPKFIPTVKIKTLITCRLEKYRPETLFWLNQHNIQYENLIMLNLPNAEERRKWNKYGEYKGNEYKKSDYIFFIESSLNEAKKIKEISSKTVFCTEIMSVV